RRHGEGRLLRVGGDVGHEYGDASETGELRGAPPALAGDDLEAIADASHHDRLDDAVRLDRLRELLQARVVDRNARLKVIGRKAIDIRVDRRGAGLRRVWYERAETFT